MRLSATRFAPTLAVLLLGCTALGGNAQAWSLFGDAKPQAAAKDVKDVKATAAAPAESLDGSIQQAQSLRIAGDYPEAIRHLSQLMMVASDDPRVISEYGKSLAAMGRSQEAVNFLTRAQQLQPGDWTVYSALGVAYDQLGNQADAKTAYEKALAIKPGEPSVLSNYALSRMLAKDPGMARTLIARAESAGGASDPKIARNMALIKDMAPANADQALAVNTPAPSSGSKPTAAPQARVVQAAPQARVEQAALQPVSPPAPVAQAAPRVAQAAPQPAPVAKTPAPAANAAIHAQPQQQAPRGVVMQRVPVDPLAGPVNRVATRAPRTLAPAGQQAHAEQPAPPQPVKTAAAQAQDLQARAEAIAKTLARPGAKAEAMAAANQPAPVQAAPPKAAEVKAAEAKPAAKPVPVKAAKDTVPALRLSANAY